jgi:predicted dehydrogenase
VKVGIIGCGSAAVSHLDALTHVRGVEVVGVCDPVNERRQATARRFGVERTYAYADELLEAAQPDVVHVLTPPQSHSALTIEALAAGCHVLVEKPMALDADETATMMDAARESGKVLSVCHTFLFSPPVLEARALASEGALGRILGAHIFWRVWRGRQDRYAATPWLHDLPGGTFHESLPHIVYLQREFLGPLRVVAAVPKPAPEVPPTLRELHLLLEGGFGVGSSHLSYWAKPYQIVLRLYGTRLSAHLDVMSNVLVTERTDGGASLRKWASVNADAARQHVGAGLRAVVAGSRRPRQLAHANLIERFYESLRMGAPPPVTAEEGRAVVELLDELWPALDAAHGTTPAVG